MRNLIIISAMVMASLMSAFADDHVNTVEYRIVSGTDDAEERSGGKIDLSSSDIELVYDGINQVVGIRFQGVMIPSDAIILRSSIQFQVDEITSVTTSLSIRGETSGDAFTFTSENRGISSRPTTSHSVNWSPPPWTTKGLAGPDQKTPDISDVIQEIIGGHDWVAGNSMAIIITGTGERVAESYEGSNSGAALLHVEYTLRGEPTLPIPDNCLNDATVIEVLSGIYTSRYRSTGPDDMVFDARDAMFINDDQYPVLIDNGACFVGGTILGQFDNEGSWEYYKNVVSGSAFRVELDNPSPFTVDGLYVDNHRDGIRVARNVPSFTIKNVYMTNIHDDCIENDFYYTGVVEDVLLDGCYTAFSARGDSDRVDGRFNEVWTIRNVLVRQQAFNGPYSGPSPGHGATFKLSSDGLSPRISLHNSIFRLDQAPSHGSAMFPEDRVRIESCSNNVIVWLGGGDLPGYLGNDPLTGSPCFTVTNDVSVWDIAKQDWLDRHN